MESSVGAEQGRASPQPVSSVRGCGAATNRRIDCQLGSWIVGMDGDLCGS